MQQAGYTYLIKIDSTGGAVLTGLEQGADKADTSLNRLGANAKGSLLGVGGGADMAGAALKRLGGIAAGLALGKVLHDMGSAGLKMGIDFEASMSTVRAVSNATNDEYRSLTAAARRAGATTVFSASESADAMGYLAQAGFNANQQIAALPGTLSLASAGSLDLARAADIATNILAQYGMAAAQSNVVADQLSLTANAFNTNVEEVAEGMKYLGPTAKAFNVSLSESNAVIGLLSNYGLKGSFGTRALSTALIGLSNPTKEAQEAMSRLGISFFDSDGKFVGLAKAMDMLNGATKDMSQQQRMAAVSSIFSAESFKAMSSLMGEGGDKIRYWTKQLDSAEGAAKRVANIKLDNLKGDLKLLSSASEELAISLYGRMQPALRGLVQTATRWVETTTLAMRQPLAKKMEEERLEANSLARQLSDTNTTEEQRADILERLRQISPDIVAGIDSEKVSLETLTANMRAYNTEAARKIFFQKKQDEIDAARDKASLKGKGANESIGNVYENVRGLVDEILAKNPEAGKYAEDIFFGVYRDKEKRSQIPKNIYDKGYLSLLDGAKNEVDMVKAEVHTIAKIGRSLGLINSANKIFNSGRGALRNIDVDKMFGSGLQGITTSLIRSDWQSYLYNHNQATGLDNQADSLQKELDEWMKKSGFALAAEEKSSDIALNAGGGGDVIPGAVDVSQNIVKGGTSQKIFNIEVHKFQDAINFYAQGVEDLKGRVDELSDMIGERFLRVVDSANSAG